MVTAVSWWGFQAFPYSLNILLPPLEALSLYPLLIQSLYHTAAGARNAILVI